MLEVVWVVSLDIHLNPVNEPPITAGSLQQRQVLCNQPRTNVKWVAYHVPW